MNARATLVAVLVAACLGAGTWWWLVKAKPAREKAREDAKLVLKGFDAASLGEVLLRAKDRPEVLLRKVEGSWRLVRPVQWAADAAGVQALLDALKGLKQSEVVVEKDADLHEFGLDQPSGAVTFAALTPGAKPTVLFFGSDNPTGDSSYAMVDGRPEVFLVQSASKADVLKDSDGLRDKTLWAVDPNAVDAVASTHAGGFSLARASEGGWEVRAGARREPANNAAVSAWLSQLAGLQAMKAAYDGPTPPAKLGLGAPKLSLKSKGLSLALSLGKEGDGGVYARVQGQPVAWVLPAYAKAQVEKDAKSLMDLQAFRFDTATAEKLTVWKGGVTLTARKKDGAWAWEPALEQKAGEAPFDFTGFLAKMAGAELLERLPASAAPKAPRMVVSVFDASGSQVEQALVGGPRGKGVLAASQAKRHGCVVPANVFEGFPDPPALKAASAAPPAPKPLSGAAGKK